ncbi:MAG: sigma-54 dependent transcriptional regulator [Alsobacter sp.]
MNVAIVERRRTEQPARRSCVLVVDDEQRSLEAVRRVLSDQFEVICASSAAEAEAVLAGDLVEVVLCDQRMPGEAGVDFLKRVRDLWPDTVRIILSGYIDAEDIIAGVNEAGIWRYVTKPWHPDELVAAVQEAAEVCRLQKQTDAAADLKATRRQLTSVVADRRNADRKTFAFDRIVHAPQSPVGEVISLARRAADYDISVLITGSSGTGKELLARALHNSSTRADHTFVVENCGALPDDLLESELFGCKKGAFTGAYQDRIGLFEVADGGTIFLDEIGETSPSFQVKLLRVLQEGEIRPLGAQRPRKVNVRVISATNRDLEAEVRAGRFRRDLYYRLAAFPIHLPALKDRACDIPVIAGRILVGVNQAFHRRIPGFEPRTLDLMMRYDWPGNVREMQNEIQRMVTLSDHDRPLHPELLSPSVRGDQRGAPEPASGTLKDQVEALERGLVEGSLGRHGGNISRAAAELGLSRVGLRNKIERYGIRGTVDDETG